MKKKFISLALVLALAASTLAGCSGGSASTSSASAASSASSATSSESKEESSSAQASSTSDSSASDAEGITITDDELIANLADYTGNGTLEGKKIGFSILGLNSDFFVALSEQLKAAVEEAGATLQVDSADADANTQIQQVENYITMGMDMIIVFAVSADALVSVVSDAKAQGVPVMAFAYEIPSDDVTISQISADEQVYGTMAAQMASDWIDEKFPDAEDGSVDVLIVGATDTTENTERSQYMETIAENSKVSYVRYDTEDPNSADDGRNTAENQFLLKEDYDVVLCVNAATALGVNAYLTSSDSPIKEENRDDVAIFLVDETTEIVENINSSIDNSSLIRGTVSMGALSHTITTMMACITNVLTDGTPISRVNGSGQYITADNVADFLESM